MDPSASQVSLKAPMKLLSGFSLIALALFAATSTSAVSGSDAGANYPLLRGPSQDPVLSPFAAGPSSALSYTVYPELLNISSVSLDQHFAFANSNNSDATVDGCSGDDSTSTGTLTSSATATATAATSTIAGTSTATDSESQPGPTGEPDAAAGIPDDQAGVLPAELTNVPITNEQLKAEFEVPGTCTMAGNPCVPDWMCQWPPKKCCPGLTCIPIFTLGGYCWVSYNHIRWFLRSY